MPGKKGGLFSRRKKGTAGGKTGAPRAMTVDALEEWAQKEASRVVAQEEARAAAQAAESSADAGEGWVEEAGARSDAVAVASSLAVGVGGEDEEAPRRKDLQEEAEKKKTKLEIKAAREAAKHSDKKEAAAPVEVAKPVAPTGELSLEELARKPTLTAVEKARLRKAGMLPSAMGGVAAAPRSGGGGWSTVGSGAAKSSGFMSIDAAFGGAVPEKPKEETVASESNPWAALGAAEDDEGGPEATEAGGDGWAGAGAADEAGDGEADDDDVVEERVPLALGTGFDPVEGVGVPLTADEFEAHALEALEQLSMMGQIEVFMRTAETTAAEAGPAMRARYVTLGLSRAIRELWEEKERGYLAPMIHDLLANRLLTRDQLNDVLERFFLGEPGDDDDDTGLYAEAGGFEDLLEDMPKAGALIAPLLVPAWEKGGIDEEVLHPRVRRELTAAASAMHEEREALEQAQREHEARKLADSMPPDPSTMSWKEKLQARKRGLIP